MKYHTKYIGRPYRCRHCEQAATERWWWTNSTIDPQTIRVAYFCTPSCAGRYSLCTLFPTKEELKADILAKTLIGTDYD